MTATLDRYVTLGRSGLRVSPICLGTMTFGTDWGWGADESASRAIFDRYLESGGNFIDTANGYTNGTSEKLVGKFMADRKNRDAIVLATKFTFNTSPGNPNAGGNGRKNIYSSLEASLRRLGTDYIDLYWLHAWDTITPVEEVVATLTDLIRAGKIRHYGFSDTPAWYATRAATLAQKDGKEALAALQLDYSLVERSIEREHIPAAQELGLGICPWGALASGLLSGKYKSRDGSSAGEGRLSTVKGTPFQGLDKSSERNWRIVEVLQDVAAQMQKPVAQVSQNWVLTQPGITSVIVGVTKTAQLEDSVAATTFTIPAELRQRLHEATALEPATPYGFFSGLMNQRILGAKVDRWTPAHATGATALEPKPPAANTGDAKEKTANAD